MYQTDPIVYSCRQLQLFWSIAKKNQTALFTAFFYWYKWAIETKLLRHVLYSYCGLTHPYVPKRRPFLLSPKIPQRNNWWGLNHFISLKERGLGLCSLISWSFLTFNDTHTVSPRISVMRLRISLNNQSFFFRKIQKPRRRKPINIWCFDRCSVKYSFPQVKLLSTLLIKRLQKEDCLSFFFPLSLVFF